jgi:ferredoxin--NADP+ reductase
MTPEQMLQLRAQRYNATAVQIRKPNPELMIVRVRPDFPRPVHKPGQYCTLGMFHFEPRFPGCQEETLKEGDEATLARRAYSISCSVLDDENRLLDLDTTDWLEFYIVLVREGGKGGKAPELTPRIFLLREGERLALGEKITGHYTLDPVKPEDTVLFLSTGTGEAPHNYMLWDLLRRGHRGKILAVCCVRLRRDLGYLAIQEELMRRYPNYFYVSLTTREPDTIMNKVYVQELLTSGRVESLLQEPLIPERTHVFLCGNPAMIGVPAKDPQTGELVYPQPRGVVEILEKRGFAVDQPQRKVKGNIHFEEYW